MQQRVLGLAALSLTLNAAPLMAAESNTATPQEVITKVQEAVRYLNEKGLAGFSDFNNNKDARWVWKDSYVFVYSCRDNVMLGHPQRPDMVGKPILQMRDDKDKPVFQELCRAGAEKNGGWAEYWWPKPGEVKASRKISYTHSAEVSFKADIQVGAGIYDDKMSVEDLNKLTQQILETKKAAP